MKCLLPLLFLCFSTSAFAQLNEDRITRDASGVFTGKVFGGTMTWVDSYGAFPYQGPTNFGKARVPVDGGNNSTVLRDDELGGDNSASVRGQAKNPVVLRGGKLIRTGGRGNVLNPGSGSRMTGAKADGTFTDKGAKWSGSFGGQGTQVFDAGGQWVYTGRKATGRG